MESQLLPPVHHHGNHPPDGDDEGHARQERPAVWSTVRARFTEPSHGGLPFAGCFDGEGTSTSHPLRPPVCRG